MTESSGATSGTYINDFPEGEHRERIRREFLGIVEHRASEYDSSLTRMTSFLGAVCSGSVVAVLALITQRSGSAPISWWAIGAVAAFTLSLVTFAASLYWHFQLHSSRWNLAAELAEGFFQRRYSVEDWFANARQYQSRTLYRVMFWAPCICLVAGVFFSVLFIVGVGPMLAKASDGVGKPAVVEQTRVQPNLQRSQPTPKTGSRLAEDPAKVAKKPASSTRDHSPPPLIGVKGG